MRRIIVAFLGAALSASAANAADLGLRTPAPVVPVAAVYNWSGCYLGGHAGGGWQRTTFVNTASVAAFGDLFPGEGYRQTDGGFIGGGQIGCNYQVNQWVFGLEGAFSGATLKSNVVNTDFAIFSGQDLFTTRVESLALVTGRVGYAWQNWLFYAKGGYAGGEVKFSVADTVGAGSSSNWRNGWTAGGGVEYGLTSHWIVGLEYNYVDLLTKSYEVGGGAGLYTFDVHPRIHEVLARVSYKF